jgi:hypothetical protein
MTLELLREVLGWALVIHLGILWFWFGMYLLAGDQVRSLHGRWFALPRESFDAIHYAGMAVYKLGIFLFVLVPYVALLIVG